MDREVGGAADQSLRLSLGLFVSATICLTAGLLSAIPVVATLLTIAGSILFLIASWRSFLSISRGRADQQLLETAAQIIANETWASFLTNGSGRILHRNGVAQTRFTGRTTDTLDEVMRDIVAGPAPMLQRLERKARAYGHSSEDIATRRGHVRLSAQEIGRGAMIWRLEQGAERMGGTRGADSMSLPMLTSGPSGTVLFMNEAFKRLTGGRARMLDKVFHDLPLKSGALHIVEGVDGPVESLVALVPASGGRQEIYLLPAGAAGRGEHGPATDWDAIEDLPVPLLKVAPSGEILASNKEARTLLPMPLGGQTRLWELLEGLGRPIGDWLRETAEGRGAAGPQFLRGTGPHRDTFVQVSLNTTGDRETPHLIAVLNDVTELKSLEAQFVQSQKMRAIGQLAGGVAHDFNNLLTAISGHCDLLLLRHDEGDPDFGDLTQIRQNVNRAASLVRQLLAFSRKQNLMPEIVDLRDTLSELTHLLNRLVGEKVTLTVEHDPDLSCIRADKRQLEQVFMNLVVNSRDAMPEGGMIRIETDDILLTSPLERDRATVPAGRYVVARVRDEGTGIPVDKLNKIFEPFYSTKRPGEGTGLGLSTAYGIVKQTGGFIFADSVVGQGSVFTLYFPAVAPGVEPLAPEPPPQENSEHVSSDAAILLVEDEAPVRAFASRALRLKGYTVLEADSAEAALKILDDPGLVIDIFVTDVIMPGLDGPSWVREALIARPETRVVFVSGYAEDAFSEHKALIPNSVFLPKPFSLTELAATVQAQIEAGAAQAGDEAPRPE
ncbi:response regulator [Ponticoccus sp. SC2-67]|nr:response regulator [Ponticoccus sp. SC2-67]